MSVWMLAPGTTWTPRHDEGGGGGDVGVGVGLGVCVGVGVCVGLGATVGVGEGLALGVGVGATVGVGVGVGLGATVGVGVGAGVGLGRTFFLSTPTLRSRIDTYLSSFSTRLSVGARGPASPSLSRGHWLWSSHSRTVRCYQILEDVDSRLEPHEGFLELEDPVPPRECRA